MDWAVFDQLGHIAQRQAGQLHLEVDVARAVVAVNHGGAARQLQCGHLAQHHRAFDARHRQAAQQRQILAGGIGQLDHDGHLPLRQVELGQRHVVVAHGGNAQGLADGGAGHAQVGGTGKVGRTTTSGRIRLAVDAMLPRPGMVRRSFSTARAALPAPAGLHP
jgi:hypothetical protein